MTQILAKCLALVFSCADEALCHLTPEGNYYINPTMRLAVKAKCKEDEEGSDCNGPMTYSWTVKIPGSKDSLPDVDQYFPTGVSVSRKKIKSLHVKAQFHK